MKADDLDFDDPRETPRLMSVPCYNRKESCPNSIQYMGVRPVHKVCHACQELGSPLERRSTGFDFDKMRRAASTVPKHFNSCAGKPVYAITVRPKSLFGGRVNPCGTEG